MFEKSNLSFFTQFGIELGHVCVIIGSLLDFYNKAMYYVMILCMQCYEIILNKKGDMNHPYFNHENIRRKYC